MPWKDEEDPGFEKSLKKIKKKNEEGVEGVFKNYSKYVQLLDNGLNVLQLSVKGFVHNEKDGLYAIDQGGEKKNQQLRMYIFPVEATEIVHILRIGTKNTQSRDIKNSKSILKKKGLV